MGIEVSRWGNWEQTRFVHFLISCNKRYGLLWLVSHRCRNPVCNSGHRNIKLRRNAARHLSALASRCTAITALLYEDVNGEKLRPTVENFYLLAAALSIPQKKDCGPGNAPADCLASKPSRRVARGKKRCARAHV